MYMTEEKLSQIVLEVDMKVTGENAVDDQTFNFTIAPVDDAPIAGSGAALDFDGINDRVVTNFLCRLLLLFL